MATINDNILKLGITKHLVLLLLTILYLFLLLTNENEIAKMQVTINGVKLEQTFTPNKATVAWLDFPQTNKSDYTFKNLKNINNYLHIYNWLIVVTLQGEGKVLTIFSF